MDIFQQLTKQAQSWTESQQKLWQDWTAALQGNERPGDVWGKAVDQWEQTVMASLDGQSAALKEWTAQVKKSADTPEQAKAVVDQGGAMLEQWSEIQRQQWAQWFSMLKSADLSTLGAPASGGQDAAKAWQDAAERMVKMQSDWFASLTPKR